MFYPFMNVFPISFSLISLYSITYTKVTKKNEHGSIVPFFPIVFVRLFMWNYLYYLNFWKSNHKFICTFMLSCIYIILWQYLIKGFWITKKIYIYNKQQISDILSCVILRMNTVKLILYNFWFGNRLYGCFRWLLVHVHVLPTR